MRALAWLLPAVLAACVLSRPIESEAGPAGEGGGAERAGAARGRDSNAAANAVAWHVAAKSALGRDIEMRTVGRGPRKVLWIGGIHGNETEGSVATEELPAAMASIEGLLDRVTLTMIRDLNPDGRRSSSRYNANGVDLNRNFPSNSFRATKRHGGTALDQPESRFLYELIRAEPPDLILVCHSTRSAKFINYDGPAREIAKQFRRESGYRLLESDRIHGTPGSLGSWAGIDQQIPILTLEWHNGMDAEVAWSETRDAILSVIDS